MEDKSLQFLNPSMASYGENVLSAGETSPADRIYCAVYAWEDSVISYDNAIGFDNLGDSAIVSKPIPAGVAIPLGAAKNITINGGKVSAILVSI